MLGNIVFNKGQGGLGRPLTGEDFISALCFYCANGNLPSGFSTSKRILQFFSIADAEAAGILPNFVAGSNADSNFADATPAEGTLTIGTVGATGDQVTLSSTEIPVLVNNISTPQVVSLGTYTLLAADNTDATGDTLATNLAAFINSGTYQHGYSATAATNVVTIICPRRLGVFVPALAYTRTGSTFVGTFAQPSGGAFSLQAIWHYHISEYFRMQPQGQLYVGFFPIPGTYNFAEVTTMQNFAQGAIRQIAVLKDPASAYASGDLTMLHNEIVNNDDGNHMPMSALYAADLSGTSDFTTLTNLQTLSAFKASAIVGQDGAGLGAYLYAGTGKSITCLGAALGAVSLAAVSNAIEWRQKFNLSNGYELDTPALANGQIVGLGSATTGYLNAIDNLGYIFCLKYVGDAGTYFNDSYTAIAVSSDYAYIENNRTIDKAIRGIYTSVGPAMASPLVLNADGTLTNETIAYLEGLAEVNLVQMERDGDLSDYDVTISPTQNVLQTGNVVMAVELLPVGVARNIIVNIGFVTSIQTQ